MTVFRCPHCNEQFQSENEGVVQCPNCDAEVRVSDPPLDGAPWDRGEGNWANAYIATIKLAFTRPTYFFTSVARAGNMGKPFVFALVNATIVAIIVAAYQIGFQTFLAGAQIAASLESLTAAMTGPVATLVGVLIMLLVVPLLTCVGIFISSGIYHLCLMLLGGATRPFVHTFRVVCYSTGPQLLQIVPLAGGMIAGVWQLVLTIMGLKTVHETTYGKVVIAVFLPMLLCCGFLVMFFAVIAGGVVGSLLSAAAAAS